MSRELPEELREMIEARKQTNPELFEKYGDPTDENDPRFWLPSSREERGVSLEDRVRYLELDQETSMLAFAPVLQWVLRKQRDEMIAELQKDPVAFLRKALESGADPQEILTAMASTQGSHGPDGDHGPAYAGSTSGIAPDTMVDTVQGKIRADQIPGYRNDPSWQPSPDWIDANCTCERHQALRAASNNGSGDDGDFSTGLYL